MPQIRGWLRCNVQWCLSSCHLLWLCRASKFMPSANDAIFSVMAGILQWWMCVRKSWQRNAIAISTLEMIRFSIKSVKCRPWHVRVCLICFACHCRRRCHRHQTEAKCLQQHIHCVCHKYLKIDYKHSCLSHRCVTSYTHRAFVATACGPWLPRRNNLLV